MSSEQGRFSDEALRAIAPTQRRAIPDPEGLIDELEQALGYLSDLAPGVAISGKPMKMARELHAAVTEHFESFQKRLSAAEMDRVTLLDILVSGAKPPSFRVRVREAWRVIRGVVNVGDLRQYAYREAKRADDELARHSKTIEYHNAEQAAAGEQIQKLTRDLAQARDERLRVLRAIETQTADRNRELAEADRHAREHIARAEALNKRIQQMEDDAKRELLYWYNPKAEIGCRWVREHQYPPGTVLEKRNAANQAIARSIDGGQTWHEVRETVVMAPENPA